MLNKLKAPPPSISFSEEQLVAGTRESLVKSDQLHIGSITHRVFHNILSLHMFISWE